MEEEIGHQMSRGEGSPDIYRADPVFFNRDGMEKYWGVSYVDNKGGNDGGKGCLAVFADSFSQFCPEKLKKCKPLEIIKKYVGPFL